MTNPKRRKHNSQIIAATKRVNPSRLLLQEAREHWASVNTIQDCVPNVFKLLFKHATSVNLSSTILLTLQWTVDR